ncbi:Pol, partial [Symbiodinium necroappetens]
MAGIEPPPPPPPEPAVEVTSVDLNPTEECAFEEGLGLAIGFTTDAPLPGYCWRVSYVVDTSKRRVIVDLGSTEVTDYAPGHNAMTFAGAGLDINE